MNEEDGIDHSNGMLQPGTGESPPLQPIEPEVEPEEVGIKLSYSGRWQDIAKLAITNSLLSFITLGIFSFWGRVRIRKYLWSHTQVNGSPLEYHGTGGQLFVGFILISLIFIGINVGFEFLQNALIQAAISGENAAAQLPITIASGVLFISVYVAFFAYIIYSVRRYWLAMTSWRGIRLRQGGKRRVMIGLALGRAILTVITLGLAYPWLALRTERYAYSNSYVGNKQFSFDTKVGPLVRGWLPFWLTMMALIIIPIIAFNIGFGEQNTDISADDEAEQMREILRLAQTPWWFLIYGLIGFLVAMVSYTFYRARLFNVGVSGIALGRLEFQGSIRASAFLSAYVRAGLLILVLAIGPMAILFPIAGAGAGGIVAGLLVVLIYMSTSGFAWNVIVVHGLWKARVAATTTTGTINVGEIQQDQVQRVRQGEGFGTAFDAGFGEA